MKMIMVGGHSRNVGKTSVVAGIIGALPAFNWTAIKITQFGHGVCATDGEDCGCATASHQYALSNEQKRDSGTDTARFLAAGAQRSLWLRTRQGELAVALPALRKAIATDQFVIVESNSLRRFITPTLYLQVLAADQPDFKLSAQQFFDLADAYVLTTPTINDIEPWPQQVSLLRERARNKPCFNVSADQHYLSDELINYLQSKLC